MSQLKQGVYLSYISIGLGAGISLLYTPIMLRLLGQSEYGVYTLVASVVSYLGLLGLGFGGAYIRYYSRVTANGSEDEAARLNGLFLLIFTVIGAATLVVGALLLTNAAFILGDKLSASEMATARVLIGLMVFSVAIAFPASVFSSFIIANERFVFQKTVQLVVTVAGPVATLTVLLLGFRSIGMAAIAVIVVLGTTMTNVYFCIRRLKMRFSFRGIDLVLAREIAIFSSYIFINMLVDQVNWNVDKFILARVTGVVAVAVYGLAGQLTGYYMVLGSTVSSVFAPRVNRMVASAEDDQELTLLLTRVGRIQFIILALICSGFVVFGRPFIVVWAGPEYRDAYPIVLLLMLPVTIPLIQNLGIEIQRAKNMHQFRSWVYLGMALMNIGISIPLAQRYGGIGAAAGTAVAMVVGNGLLMNLYYHHRVGLNMRYFWRQVFGFTPAMVLVVAVGAAIMVWVDLHSVLSFGLCAVSYLAVYCIAMWLFGLNDYEKGLLRLPAVRAFK